MYINNNDLYFLLSLVHRLGMEEGATQDVKQIFNLCVQLLEQRDAGREKTKQAIAERRKTDKNYARENRKKGGAESDT